jgi:hypothetical protein
MNAEQNVEMRLRWGCIDLDDYYSMVECPYDYNDCIDFDPSELGF